MSLAGIQTRADSGRRILFVLAVACFTACEKFAEVDLETVNFPDAEWVRAMPEQAGLDRQRWERWVERQAPTGAQLFGEDHSNGRWGAALVRGGYLVQTWGNPEYRYQSASIGKAFTKLALQLAVDEGLISSDRDRVRDYWTGRGELNDPVKYLDNGHHRTLTFRNLWQHRGGFPISNGYLWKHHQDVPEWARWTGDPDRDNYAHIAPDTVERYSSGGYWRLTQALTAIWGRDLKSVLDDKLFSHIGLPADRWDWLSGRQVRETKDFYPAMPGYGGFVDPPYELDGEPCVGGGGWVVMSALDLARVGLLIATGGVWDGKRLISDTELVDGHAGGNDSELYVRRSPELLVFTRVTTTGFTGLPLEAIDGTWHAPDDR